MLKLNIFNNESLSVERAQRAIELNRLKSSMYYYFGFTTRQQVTEALALRQTIRNFETNRPENYIDPGDATNPQSIRNARERLEQTSGESSSGLAEVFNDILDIDNVGKRYLDSSVPNSANGTPDTNDINATLKKIIETRLINPNDPRYREKLHLYARCIRLHYTTAVNHSEGPAYSLSGDRLTNDPDCLFFNNLGRALPYKENPDGSNVQFLNEVKKRVVAVRMEHPLMAPGDKTADLLTMFFNAMPPLEMTRATPVMNVTIYSTRPPITENGRLSALTLQKFTEGAVEEPIGNDNLPLKAINNASLLQSNTGISNDYSVVTGLELFRAPQTMQNIEASKQNQNHLAPIIDPMRPLASIKGFSLDMQSSYGLNGTRSGTLEIVLHDRSRLGEFANFIKPDRYGTAFIEVEYGWSHPDPLGTNPFADLLNLSRVKDHLNIVQTSFNFDEVGQVNITLNLIGRGSSETSELSLIGPDDASRIQTQIREIENLSTIIKQLSSRIPGLNNTNQDENTSSSTQRQEIRGIQALSAAQDAVNNLVLDGDMLQSVRDLQQSLSARSRSSDQSLRNGASALSRAITRLLGVVTTQRNSESLRISNVDDQNRPTVVSQFKASINEEIQGILTRINYSDKPYNRQNYYNDIFLQTMPPFVWNKLTTELKPGEQPIDGNHLNAVRQDDPDLTNLSEAQSAPIPPPAPRRSPRQQQVRTPGAPAATPATPAAPAATNSSSTSESVSR